MPSRALSKLSEYLLGIASIPLLAMMFHVTLDVFLKYTFGAPIQGTLEVVAYYYMVSIVVLPLAFIELSRQSISVELFYQVMPRRIKLITVLIVLTISFAAYAVLAWISWYEALEAFERQQIVMGAVRVLVWPPKFLLPVSFALAASICVLHTFRLITNPTAREVLLGVNSVETESNRID